MNLKTKLYSCSRRNFSSKITSEKERRLNQFFKLPKSNLQFPNNVFDRPESEYSVLQSYNDQELDKLDIMDKVIKKKKLDSERNINKFFNNNTTEETIKITENLIEKLRLNKEFKFTEEYKQKEILNQYGNYDKYFKNYKVTKEKGYDSNDDGESRWEIKYNELQEKYKNPATKESWEKNKQSIEDKMNDDINNYGAKFTFTDYLNEKRKEENANLDMISTNPRTVDELKEESYKKLKRELTPRTFKEETYDHRTKREKDLENKKKLQNQFAKDLKKAGFNSDTQNNELAAYEESMKKKIVGRVSPWCKEEIYKHYLEGWTIKDLSYKYGLLPERVKVIVWMRNHFWKEVYPKIGESGLRRRLEVGMQYAKKFAYIDYGKDLEEMAFREQGVFLRKIDRSEIDCKPSKEVEEKVSEVLRNIKTKKCDHIPVSFYGKGPSGYLIKEMVCRRGLGSKRVSFMFQKYFYYKDKHPNLLPEKVLARKELGARIATLGYKF